MGKTSLDRSQEKGERSGRCHILYDFTCMIYVIVVWNQSLIIIEIYTEGQWIPHGVSKYDPFGISKQLKTSSMYDLGIKKSFWCRLVIWIKSLIIIENHAEGQLIPLGISKHDHIGISKQSMTRFMYDFGTKMSFLMQGSDLNQIFDHHGKSCGRSINTPRGLQIWSFWV